MLRGNQTDSEHSGVSQLRHQERLGKYATCTFIMGGLTWRGIRSAFNPQGYVALGNDRGGCVVAEDQTSLVGQQPKDLAH